jgi:hypothetical protein
VVVVGQNSLHDGTPIQVVTGLPGQGGQRQGGAGGQGGVGGQGGAGGQGGQGG